MTTTAITRVPSSGLLDAAFGLARRIAGSDETACRSVEAAVGLPWRRPADLLRATRAEARARRTSDASPAHVPRPDRLRSVSPDAWATLERVALRGMTVTEAASDQALDRREVLLRLREGLIASREALLDGEWDSRDDADAARHDGLRGDRAAVALGDPSRDREAEAAARPLVAA